MVVRQTELVRDSIAVVHGLVEGISPFDALESQHRADTLRWLERTDDVFRRSKPATPARHLVSYVVMLDDQNLDVLLVDHLNAGLFLPPAATSRLMSIRQRRLDENAVRGSASKPALRTTNLRIHHGHDDHWTRCGTRRPPSVVCQPGISRHATDSRQGRIRGARWWSLEEVTSADGMKFDPHFREVHEEDCLIETTHAERVRRASCRRPRGQSTVGFSVDEDARLWRRARTAQRRRAPALSHVGVGIRSSTRTASAINASDLLGLPVRGARGIRRIRVAARGRGARRRRSLTDKLRFLPPESPSPRHQESAGG